MAEKGKRQRGCPANSAETRADRPLDLAEVVRAEVGKFAALDVAPHEFGGIELRRVARQALNGKPRALSRQVRGHVAAFMRRQAIPDQEETPTAKMILELVQEADERDVVVTARPRLEEEATAPEVPPERQAHGEGELRPVEGMDQDGGLPARGPSRSALSTRVNCSGASRGLRPARPAARSASRPPLRHARYHRITLWRLTPRRRAIAPCVSRPVANNRAACFRRTSNPWKSR